MLFFFALNNLRLLENHYKKKLNKGDVMGEFLNIYVLKSIVEDNDRYDVSTIFTDLIYEDVDKPFGPKLIKKKKKETRPNNNLIFLFFLYLTFLKIWCYPS